MSEEVWQEFERSLDFPRQYAMRRSAVETVYLRRALREGSNLVRYNAAQDLLRLGEDARDAVLELVHCSESKPKKTADICEKALEKFSPLPDEAIVPLLPQMARSFSPSGLRAKQLLTAIEKGDVAYDSKVAFQIGSSLTSTSAGERAEAARLAGLKGLEPSQGRLLELLKDKSAEVRLGSAIGLSYLSSPLDASLESTIEKELRAGLQSSKGMRQKEIARILDVELPKRAVRVATVQQSIKVEEDNVERREGTTSTSAQTETLEEYDSMLAVRVAQDVVRDISLKRLEQREPERLAEWRRQLPYLRKAVSTGSRTEQVAGVRVLGAMADYLPEAIALLLRALASPEPEVRERAAKLLGEHRVEQAVGPLSGLLAESSVRETAAVALLRIGTKEAVREAKQHLSAEELANISIEKVVLRGEDKLSAGGVRQRCEREFRRRGYSKSTLGVLSKECVRASGAYF